MCFYILVVCFSDRDLRVNFGGYFLQVAGNEGYTQQSCKNTEFVRSIYEFQVQVKKNLTKFLLNIDNLNVSMENQ